MVDKILELLNEIYPVDIIEVKAVTNEMFRCITKQGDCFARITNYKNYDEQLEEVNYTNFLYKEGLGVSPTISSLNGKVVEKITLNNNERLTVLYQSAPGVHLPRNQWNANILKELGRQIGRLHRFSKNLKRCIQLNISTIGMIMRNMLFSNTFLKKKTAIREIAEEVLLTIKKCQKIIRIMDYYMVIYG